MFRIYRTGSIAMALLLSIGLKAQQHNGPLYTSPYFSIYADSVVQPPFVSRIVSSGEIVSDYKSQQMQAHPALVNFKFSINGKDNEMKSGLDHGFIVVPVNGEAVTPVIVFGQQLKPGNTDHLPDLVNGTKLTLRVDMRPVLNEIKTKGFYTTVTGTKIYKDDFKGLYVAGSVNPLSWDFDNLVNHPEVQLKDVNGDGIYETTLTLNFEDKEKQTAPVWRASKDVAAFPQYHSPYAVADASYRLALDEMINAVEPDSTFRTGKEWAGVWTRDISYSIMLAMGELQPKVAYYSLMRKVNKKKIIIQDTGTGGAWPCSSDRVIWSVAAWELYKVTGDKNWLQEAYTVIKNTLEQDQQNIYDPVTGLAKGESSFLDWREQTYPRWMQPADIFESENLGTNAVHYQANKIAARMATLLNDPVSAKKFETIAERIKTGINKYLWMPDKQYYGQYLYGRTTKVLSRSSEALGEALCVVFGIADAAQQKAIVSHVPQTGYGIPCIYPEIPGIPPYHNNAVWPFVQSFWLWASAQVGNEASVNKSIADIYRPAALFATNKENFVAETGDYAGTQINSSNMLWSLSGNLSIVHKVLFGLRFEENRLGFQPYVPKVLAGERSLTNLRYRNAVLDIHMEGYGSQIKSFLLDGVQQSGFALPATLQGHHSVAIVLDNKDYTSTPINEKPVVFAPNMPLTTIKDGKISWLSIEGAVYYRIIKNGKFWKNTKETSFPVAVGTYADYGVAAIGKDSLQSFYSEPIAVVSPKAVKEYQLENYASISNKAYKGFTGKGFVEISTETNTRISVPVTVAKTGYYLLDVRYANGNGPTSTENKCAIRTVFADAKNAGVFVFPQRGKEEWSNWGFSNSVRVYLKAGKHVLHVNYLPANENMNETVNQAMLDYLRITALQ